MQTEILDTVIAQIEQVFRPKAVICQINRKGYIIERIAAGWCWRNEDGDCQEDFGIAPFQSATEAQADALRHVKELTAKGFQPVHCSYPSWTDIGPVFPTRQEAEAWLAKRKKGKDWGYVMDLAEQARYEAELKAKRGAV